MIIPVEPTYDWCFMVYQTITALYNEELEREPDDSGRASMMSMALQGKTAEDLRIWIRMSDEWKNK